MIACFRTMALGLLRIRTSLWSKDIILKSVFPIWQLVESTDIYLGLPELRFYSVQVYGKITMCREWWCTPVIPVCRKQRPKQGGFWFKASLGYRERYEESDIEERRYTWKGGGGLLIGCLLSTIPALYFLPSSRILCFVRDLQVGLLTVAEDLDGSFQLKPIAHPGSRD